MHWTPIVEQAPEPGRVVMTKIDDANGGRNEQALKREGNLWFLPDGSMYVYYRPTHWREMTPEESAGEAATMLRRAEAKEREAASLRERAASLQE